MHITLFDYHNLKYTKNIATITQINLINSITIYLYVIFLYGYFYVQKG